MTVLYYRIILIVLTVACGMGAVVTVPFAMFAAMAFSPRAMCALAASRSGRP
jgi:hypothetical protein